jgi:hypothetical protein
VSNVKSLIVINVNGGKDLKRSRSTVEGGTRALAPPSSEGRSCQKKTEIDLFRCVDSQIPTGLPEEELKLCEPREERCGINVASNGGPESDTKILLVD